MRTVAGMQDDSADFRLRQLECFVTLAEVCNFSQAAKSLYMSQPTLSAQIKTLEKQLGKQLFLRSGRTGVTLTQEGVLLLNTSREVLREIRHAVARIERLQSH